MKTYDVLGFDYLVEGEWIRMYDYEPGRWKIEISPDGAYHDVCFRGGGELLSGQGFWQDGMFYLNEEQRLVTKKGTLRKESAPQKNNS